MEFNEKLHRRIAEMRATKQRERDLASESKVTLETFLSRAGCSAHSSFPSGGIHRPYGCGAADFRRALAE